MSATDSYVSQFWKIPKALFNGESIMASKLQYQDLTFQLEIYPVDHDILKPLQVSLRLIGRVFGQKNMICNLHLHFPNKIRPFINIPISYSFVTSDPLCIVKSSVTYKNLESEGWFLNDELMITITLSSSPEISKDIGQINNPPGLDNIIRKILQPHSITGNSVLSKSEINWLCVAATSLFMSQPCLLRLKAPMVVVGDLHGRYYDLLRIFRKYGFPDKVNYLFLGDYVDRGDDSLDIITLLFALKLKFPENLYLIRGNHECEMISTQYGFKEECRKKGAPYMSFIYAFGSLPLAAVINEKVFCVHGGLSPSISSLKDIESFERPAELPKEGIINDITWADPSTTIQFYGPTARNTSVSYGKEASKAFLDNFGFEMVLRAHEVVPNGFKFPFGETMNVVTLFSAPNYYEANNGATLVFDENLRYCFDTFKDFTKAEVNEISNTDFSTQLQL